MFVDILARTPARYRCKTGAKLRLFTKDFPLLCHNSCVDLEGRLRQTICDVGRRLWDRGLLGACEGNISARVDSQRLLCTPSGLCKGFMSPSDLVIVDYDGRASNGAAPSSEIGIHLKAYERRDDCFAVVHAHPLTAIGMTVAGTRIPDDVLVESGAVLGPVAHLGFAYPGTPDVAQGLEEFIRTHKTFLLSHHGAMTLGSDLWDACDRMETLERVAKIITIALSLGHVQPMPSDAVLKMSQTHFSGRLG